MIALPIAAGLLNRIGPGLIGAIAVAGLLVGTHWKAYSLGERAAEAVAAAELDRIRAEADQERIDALQRLNHAERQVAEIQAEADQRVAAAEKRASANVRTVERVARENPGFASILRPADLQRLRDDDLDAIEAAAARSADLSRQSLRGVRAAREGEGSGAR